MPAPSAFPGAIDSFPTGPLDPVDGAIIPAAWGDLVNAAIVGLETEARLLLGLARNVVSYGADPTGAADSRAAIQAAIDVGPGFVFVPFGTFKCLGTLNVKDGVILVGVGVFASILSFPVDIGSGATNTLSANVPAIDLTVAGVQRSAAHLRDLRVVGPNSAQTLGTRGVSMDGVKVGANSSLKDVEVEGFGANIVQTENHTYMERVKSHSGFYNLLYASPTASKGNHTYINCLFESAAFSAVACGGDNTLDLDAFYNCNFTRSPYIFYKADGPSASTAGFLKECVLVNPGFEGVGNGVILDESTGGGSGSDTMVGGKIENPGMTWDGSFKIAARVDNYTVKTRNCNSVEFVMGSLGLVSGDLAVFDGGYSRCTLELGYQNANQKWFSGSNTAGFRVLGHEFAGGTGGGWEAVPMAASGTIVGGDILEWDGTGRGVRRFNNTGGYAGVAVFTPQNGIVMVGWHDLGVLCETITGSGKYITPHTTKHHGQEATAVPSTTAQPIIGVSPLSGGGAGGSICNVMVYRTPTWRN